MLDHRRYVKAGAAWLDEVKPGWYDLINLDSLKMMSPKLCVCGQVFHEEAVVTQVSSGHSYVVARLFPDPYDRVEFGFASDKSLCAYEVNMRRERDQLARETHEYRDRFERSRESALV